MEQIHANPFDGGHVGAYKSKVKLTENFYWPGMNRDMENYIRKCETCLFTKNRSGPELGKIHSHSIPSRPLSSMLVNPMI